MLNIMAELGAGTDRYHRYRSQKRNYFIVGKVVRNPAEVPRTKLLRLRVRSNGRHWRPGRDSTRALGRNAILLVSKDPNFWGSHDAIKARPEPKRSMAFPHRLSLGAESDALVRWLQKWELGDQTRVR